MCALSRFLFLTFSIHLVQLNLIIFIDINVLSRLSPLITDLKIDSEHQQKLIIFLLIKGNQISRCLSFFSLSFFVSLPFPLSLLGGPVPLVGVTITMDDEVMNGTNRVVLDGVLSKSECDTVMQLASVSC